MTSQIDKLLGCGQCEAVLFYLSHGMVWYVRHMGKNNGNPDPVCEKCSSYMHTVKTDQTVKISRHTGHYVGKLLLNNSIAANFGMIDKFRRMGVTKCCSTVQRYNMEMCQNLLADN